MLRPEQIDKGVRDVKATKLSPSNEMFIPVLAIFCKVNAAICKRGDGGVPDSMANVLLMSRRYSQSMAVSEEEVGEWHTQCVHQVRPNYMPWAKRFQGITVILGGVKMWK